MNPPSNLKALLDKVRESAGEHKCDLAEQTIEQRLMPSFRQSNLSLTAIGAVKSTATAGFTMGFDSRNAEIEKLIRVIEVQGEALETYGNYKNWTSDAFNEEEQGYLWKCMFLPEGQDYSEHPIATIMYAGRRARTAQKQALEILEGE